ncbi:transposase [Ammonifex degensii]|uniref:transposase n=1 Tax=Ammonifex degensii TaxID=42838 RepID=UPI0002F2E29E|nr:transposase [Ammonifex degensii]
MLKLSREKELIRCALPEGWDTVTLPDGTEIRGIPVEVKVKAVVRRRRVENLVLHVTLDLGVMPVYRSVRTGMEGKKASQKIKQMAYDRLRQEQRYKNLMRGIETDNWRERNTSSTCCLCGAHGPAWRKHRGLGVCRRCGLVLQADLNGAANLLKQYLFGDCHNRALPFTFREARVWRWDGKLNRFVQVSPRAA